MSGTIHQWFSVKLRFIKKVFWSDSLQSSFFYSHVCSFCNQCSEVTIQHPMAELVRWNFFGHATPCVPNDNHCNKYYYIFMCSF
jgi:hypothetical protein